MAFDKVLSISMPPEPTSVPSLARTPAFARTPAPPYFAVIFTSIRAEDSAAVEASSNGRTYGQTADEMEALAKTQPGYLGFETARTEGGLGISVSYWESLDAIRAWKANADHLTAQRFGRHAWYRGYRVRVCRVEREYGLDAALVEHA